MTDFLNRAAPRAVFERYLTISEEKRLLAHIAKHVGSYAKRDHAWMRLARFSGLRLGSLRGLTLGDARAAIRSGQLRAAPEHAKNGNGYDVSVSSGIEKALRDLIAVRRAMRLPEDDDAPLICSRLGRGLSERSFQDRMKVWRESAGIHVAASPHWLRHTLAKRMLDQTTARDPLGVVQIALGHASRQSTTVYTLPSREEVAQAMEDACK